MKGFSRTKGILGILLISCCFALLFGNALSGRAVAIVVLLGLLINFIGFNIKPSGNNNPVHRLRIMYNGRELMLVFTWAFVFHIIIGVLWKTCFSLSMGGLIAYIVSAVLLDGIVVINGFVRIFTTSKQLGIVWRVLSALLWWLPILNIYLMVKACRVVHDEYELETEKNELDEVRKESEICHTKYPIVMVHGVFFRDLRFFNYWGRVPKELIRNGAQIYYGEQHSAASVESNARELKERIEKIVKETGCEKVNIIAHSKGGLDSRYAITHLGLDKYTASLTTVNTPHRGCSYADYLLKIAPAPFLYFISSRYNSALRRLGESNPDFTSAVKDLTVANCTAINEKTPDMDGVYYQSIGARMKNHRSAAFPLNLVYILVKHFSKSDNDGLVDVNSMPWGSRHIFFEPATKRGLSHGDMIDLMREDIKGFDVREEYVKIVKGLKDMGF